MLSLRISRQQLQRVLPAQYGATEPRGARAACAGIRVLVPCLWLQRPASWSGITLLYYRIREWPFPLASAPSHPARADVFVELVDATAAEAGHPRPRLVVYQLHHRTRGWPCLQPGEHEIPSASPSIQSRSRTSRQVISANQLCCDHTKVATLCAGIVNWNSRSRHRTNTALGLVAELAAIKTIDPSS